MDIDPKNLMLASVASSLDRIAEALEVANGMAVINAGLVKPGIPGDQFIANTMQMALDRLKAIASAKAAQNGSAS